MTEIMNEVEAVFQTISSIPVTGDAVDAVAVARAKLRGIHASLRKMDEENRSKEAE